MPEVKAQPLDFFLDNMTQQMALLEAANNAGIKRLVMTSSASVYPEWANIPLREEDILSGKLPEDLEAYGLSKALGVKLCEYYQRQHGNMYTAAVLSNVYGEGTFQNTQFLPSLIRRFREAINTGAESVSVWGTGTATRDFVHVDDCAAALIHAAHYFSGSVINVGSGQETSIAEAVETAKSVTGYKGQVVFDNKKPEGAPRSCLDISILKSLGWQPSIDLKTGLEKMWLSVPAVQKQGHDI